MSWTNFNDADNQDFEVIPAGTLAKVRMTIKPGGHDDPDQGWTGGFATYSSTTGVAYLNCEFVVLEGKYAHRKVWSLIGLHSPKGPDWADIGRAFIKSILNSARGISRRDDTSADAQKARCIGGLGDLDGIEFVVRISVQKDQYGEDKNVIKIAITPDHKEYAALMGDVAQSSSSSSVPAWGK